MKLHTKKDFDLNSKERHIFTTGGSVAPIQYVFKIYFKMQDLNNSNNCWTAKFHFFFIFIHTHHIGNNSADFLTPLLIKRTVAKKLTLHPQITSLATFLGFFYHWLLSNLYILMYLHIPIETKFPVWSTLLSTYHLDHFDPTNSL